MIYSVIYNFYLYSIVDYKDPKYRMITVTKWFLSAFHAGRKVKCKL